MIGDVRAILRVIRYARRFAGLADAAPPPGYCAAALIIRSDR